MATKFSFWAYGILAIAAFAMLLYTTTSLSGRPDIGSPLLNIAGFIVVAFIVYMFAKLLLRYRY
jgi:VIT1/CCC1 family predicted Fe2+/Mn2+ transporter